MRKLEWVQECKTCDGTGLYVGICERGGAAVVCSQCKGSGRQEMKVKYKDFTAKKIREDVTQVYASACGVVLYPAVTPGGVPYDMWREAPTTVKQRGAEIREHTCPAWWYQSVDYKLKPNWDECIACGVFKDCEQFENKSECWKRFDAEQDAKEAGNAEDTPVVQEPDPLLGDEGSVAGGSGIPEG